jgi:hypothetical protein
MSGLVLARFAPVNGVRRAFTRGGTRSLSIARARGPARARPCDETQDEGGESRSGADRARGASSTLLLVRRMFLRAKLLGSQAI